MTDKRYKELMIQCGMPDSNSLLQVLKQLANEIEQDKKTLQYFKTTDLLKEIINREGYSSAPKKTERMGNWHSCIVGIGKDNVADICLDDDDLKVLFNG